MWFVVRRITCSRYNIVSSVVNDNSDNLRAITDAHHYFEIAVLTRKRDRLCAQKALKCIVLCSFWVDNVPIVHFQ